MAYFALIPAAGSGTRLAGLGNEGPKQYRRIAGKPMLWHSLRAVLRPPIETAFIVLAAGDRDYAAEDWSAFGKRAEPLYCGGATRAESVYNGLVAAAAELQPDDWVLVHDAARPCLPAADLAALIAECSADAVGGILALPVAETVKRVAKDDAGVARVAATEDRQLLWLAQTPQMFRAALLAAALRAALNPLRHAGRQVTDEASAIESLGLRPRVVAGSRENLKVTWPQDLALAEAMLKHRGSA